MKQVRAWPIFAAALLFLLACSGPASLVPEPTDTPPVTPSQAATSTFTAFPSTTLPVAPSPAASSTFPAFPSVTVTSTASTINANPQLLVLADQLPGPDDLLLAADGSILLSDVSQGTIQRFTPQAGLQRIVSGLSEPEGMLFLPDGSLIVAEQGKNRLTRVDPITQQLTPFVELRNTTGQPGVDGIAWDAASQTIIIPDSPNGTILRLDPNTRTVTQLASGFARPTGAWIEPDGSILVADENGNSLDRIHPDGSTQEIIRLQIPDDVIEDRQGNIFVNTWGDRAIHWISGTPPQDTVIATGLIDPQGIIFDANGNLIVTDAGNHRLIKLVIR